MSNPQTAEDVRTIIEKHPRNRSALIPILQDVQKEFRYISEEAVEAIAEHLEVSENDVYGVATFYTQFRFSRPGDHIITVCQGTACHVRGGKRILEEVCRDLGIREGETTPDYRFSIERIACFGSCALAPVVVIDNKVYGRMTPQKVRTLLKGIE